MDNYEYIGDGVYAAVDGFHVWLLVGSHDNPTDRVALEPSVFAGLLEYRARMVAEQKLGE